MKKQLLTLALLAVAGTAGAQYQLPNGDFEGGYTNKVSVSSNTGNQVPNSWHWFHDRTGTISDVLLAVAKTQNYVVTDGNNHYVKLVQGGVGGNGNLTTGIINAGSHKATTDGGLSNYNWSDPTGKGDNKTKVPTDRSMQKEGTSAGQTFSGKPDAIKFKYAAYLNNASQRIQLRAVVHGEGRYRDPEYSKDNYDDIKWGVATFNDTRTLSSSSDKVVLKEAQAEFVAGINQSSITPAAVLVSLTTNENPGVGDKGNFACFDDIEFVYYHALNSAKYDGKDIPNFAEKTLNYDLSSQVYDEKKFAYTVKGVGARVVENYNEATGLLTVTVNGNNISADATSKTVYTFQFKKVDYTGMLSALSVNGKGIEAFAEDRYHYTVVDDYIDGCVKATTKGADDAVTTNYDAATRICSINVVGGTEENTYFVKFAKATTDYKGKMSIAMNGGWLSAATSTVGITTPVDGKADFQLLGFALGDLSVGDIFVTDVPYVEENGVVSLYKEQTITIFGDNSENMRLIDLPVVLTGTLKDGKLTANIGITWNEEKITVDLVPLDATSLDFSSNAVDLENTSLAGMKADMTNKNLTIFLPEGTMGVDAKGKNVVVGTTASSLSLIDGNDWGVTKDFTAAAVSYDRVFNTEDNYVQSFVLPFGFTVPTGTTVAELSSVNGDNLVFKPVAETVANKPYLVVTNDADFINKLKNVQVKATTGADLTTTVDGVSHIGSYTAQNVEGVYGYANGKFVKANTGPVKPFRTYVKVAGQQAAPMAFGVNIEGTVTGINNATTAATAKEAIYNLQGVRVSGDLKHLTKGVYIVNGQKVVVK